MSVPTRALVLDDLAASRRWLRAALEQAYPGIVVVEAASLADAETLLLPLPELALIDLGLPDGSGVRMIERLCAAARCAWSPPFLMMTHTCFRPCAPAPKAMS